MTLRVESGTIRTGAGALRAVGEVVAGVLDDAEIQAQQAGAAVGDLDLGRMLADLEQQLRATRLLTAVSIGELAEQLRRGAEAYEETEAELVAALGSDSR